MARPVAPVAKHGDTQHAGHTILKSAFRVCEQMARRHYENFPVGRFLPQPQRRHVAAVYAFARVADDIADEPSFHGDRAARLRALYDWERQLRRCHEGLDTPDTTDTRSDHPVFVALAETVAAADLPLTLFTDLLTAFRMDAEGFRPKTVADLLHYCRYSANPIGRLVLMICGARDPRLLAQSDAICTALQLTNFWQDLAIDLARGRCYLPQDDLARFGVTEADLAARHDTPALRALLAHTVDMTRRLFTDGRGLPAAVHGSLRFELRLVWLGGMRVLERLEASGYDVFRHRPTLTTTDKVLLLARAFTWRS